MRNALAFVVLTTLWAAPAMANGYLSDYGYSNGNYYGYSGNGPLDRYHSPGYTPPSTTSTNLGYSGPSTPISRPHRASWEAYLNARQGRAGIGQRTVGWYNPAGIRIGLPSATAGPQPCGNYQRAPAGCWRTTTRFDPLVHTEY